MIPFTIDAKAEYSTALVLIQLMVVLVQILLPLLVLTLTAAQLSNISNTEIWSLLSW